MSGKAQKDQRRHLEKIKDVVKKQLPKIISNQRVVGGDKKKIPVIIRELQEWQFIPKSGNNGTGSGDYGEGDVIESHKKRGKGNDVGDEHLDGVPIDIDKDTILDWVLEDLNLPNLDKNKKGKTQDTVDVIKTYTKKGAMSNLDKRKSVIESIKRRASQGKDSPMFLEDDLRFKSYSEKEKESYNAVVFFLRDYSGSITEENTYISQIVSLLFYRFLTKSYPKVEIRWFIHDTDIEEVDEDKFFTISGGGGTRFYPSYAHIKELADNKYPVSSFNRYLLHFTDGETWADDIEKTVNVMESMDFSLIGLGRLSSINYIGYMDSVVSAPNLANKLPANVRYVKFYNREDIGKGIQKLLEVQDE